jgi:uncharacterized protein involved in exopolysaccharide biosynthesis
MTQDTALSATAADADDDEISLLDLLQVVVENLRLLVLGPLAAGLVALGICFIIPPTYTATTVFMPPQQQQSGAALMMQSLGALGGLAGAATGLKNPNDQFVSFLKSDSVADALIERFELIARYEAEFKTDARKALSGVTTVTSGKDGLITVAVEDTDRVFAAQLANGYVEEFGSLLNRMAVTEAQLRRAFFEKQLLDATEKYKKSEMALQDSGISASALKSSPEATIGAVATLQAQVNAQEIRLSSMRGYLAETAPEFKQAQTELAALRAQFAKLEKSNAGSSKGESEYLARYRDFKYYQTLFELFSKQFELAKLDEAREGAVIQVLDVAQPPERKSKPKKAQLAVITALAVGFLLLLFVFVRNALRQAGSDLESREKLFRLSRAWSRAIGR